MSEQVLEVVSGIWVNGRHNRAAGFNAYLEKYLEAGLLGWRVFRLGLYQISIENVARLERRVRGEIDRFSTESTRPLDAQFIELESTNAKRAVKKVES